MDAQNVFSQENVIERCTWNSLGDIESQAVFKRCCVSRVSRVSRVEQTS